ncbi:MAG: protein-S-isoprenylcysteine methyltransferase [Pseudohongiella sp.]|nr:MAG: protein-S-isoprenylcysteine methyltransferase [Pseudohongiella sp.]
MSEEPQGDSVESEQGVEDRKGAAVSFPPPAIFASCILVGAGLQSLWPIALGVPESLDIFGYVLVLLGVGITVAVALNFKRVDTAIEPWKPTSSIVTTGLYAWSRNPIYAGFCLVIIGVGIASNSFWVFISFLPGAILLYHVAIKKEEAYLEQKFGEEYLAYKRKVRRWI